MKLDSFVMDFQDHGLRFEVGPAFVDLNPLFRAASEALLKPYALAAQLGRLDEKHALQLLARAYSESVIISADPEMSRDEVFSWLLSHEEDFNVLRSYAEHRDNFVSEGRDGNQLPEPGPSPDQNQQTADNGAGTSGEGNE